MFFIGILFSCNNNEYNRKEEKKIANIQIQYVAKKTIESIRCKKDSTQKYTAYFPATYNKTKQNKIIVVFDAHARAKLIIKKFKEAADKFDYLIIASENIRNNLESVDYSINILFEDIFSRFNINKQRVYTAGFSGGAKVANSVAIYKGGIAGVIALSGGLPKQGIKIKSKFDYVGIVGEEDFMYQEMQTLDRAFDKNEFNNNLIIFDGKHQYPNKETITKAVELLEIAAIKRKIIPVNDNLLRNYTESEANRINNLLVNNKDYKAYILYKKFLKNLDGLYDISEYKKGYQTLIKRQDVQKKIEINKQIAVNEATKQEEFIDLFVNSDFATLNAKIISLKNNLKDNSERRLLNYVEMLCYVFTNNALKFRDFKNFNQLITIYNTVNHNNADKEYFKACKFAIGGDNTNVLKYLSKAVEYGFYDKYRLLNSGYFEGLNNNNKFIEILNKISVH